MMLQNKMALKLTQGNLPLLWVHSTVSRARPYNGWQACHHLHFETPRLLVRVLYMCVPSKAKLGEQPERDRDTERKTKSKGWRRGRLLGPGYWYIGIVLVDICYLDYLLLLPRNDHTIPYQSSFIEDGWVPNMKLHVIHAYAFLFLWITFTFSYPLFSFISTPQRCCR